MKQRDLSRRRVFWGKWLDLWFVCWVVYCACEYLLLRLLFRETMPHLRDYSVLGWTQHFVFAAVYFLIYTRPACQLDPPRPEEGFRLRKTLGEFFGSIGDRCSCFWVVPSCTKLSDPCFPIGTTCFQPFW